MANTVSRERPAVAARKQTDGHVARAAALAAMKFVALERRFSALWRAKSSSISP
jgi:hypothetical protein